MRVETVSIVATDEEQNVTRIEVGAYTCRESELITVVTGHMRDYIEASGKNGISLADFSMYLLAQAHLQHERNQGELADA